jgi:hypothetical protein
MRQDFDVSANVSELWHAVRQGAFATYPSCPWHIVLCRRLRIKQLMPRADLVASGRPLRFDEQG